MYHHLKIRIVVFLSPRMSHFNLYDIRPQVLFQGVCHVSTGAQSAQTKHLLKIQSFTFIVAMVATIVSPTPLIGNLVEVCSFTTRCHHRR